MSFLKQFSIQFASLKPGSYNFKFAVDEKFFEKFNESETKKGKVSIQIEFQKQARMLILNFKLKGRVELVCDRCLENFEYNLKSEERLIVKFGNEREEETDEIIIIQESDHEINVAHYIYEFIHLAFPTKRVHPDEKFCNREIISKLEKLKSKNNIEDEADPRWEALKKIKFN